MLATCRGQSLARTMACVLTMTREEGGDCGRGGVGGGGPATPPPEAERALGWRLRASLNAHVTTWMDTGQGEAPRGERQAGVGRREPRGAGGVCVCVRFCPFFPACGRVLQTPLLLPALPGAEETPDGGHMQSCSVPSDGWHSVGG